MKPNTTQTIAAATLATLVLFTPAAAAQSIAGLGSRGSSVGSEAGFGQPRTVALPAAPSKTQLTTQASLASGAGLKIYVAREGWYRITRSQMAAAGYDPGTNPASLELYTSATNLPVFVDAGTDGRFDPADAVEFYGLPLDTPSTGARTYWLRTGTAGLRTTAPAFAKASSTSTASVPCVVEVKDRTLLASTAVYAAQGSDLFYGGVVASTPLTKTVTLGGVDAAGAAYLEVVLQGGFYDVSNSVRVDLNGYPAGSLSVNPRLSAQTFRIDIPASRLSEGANTVSLTALGGSADVSALVALRIGYAHKLQAEQGALTITLPGSTQATVTGFASAAVKAIDVTNPLAPALLGVSATADGTVTVAAPRVRGNVTIQLVGAERIQTAAEMAVNRSSAWKANAASLKANIVLVAPKAFSAAADQLATARAAAGLTALVVDTEDIWDEYGFGTRSPAALQAFLKDTQRWKTAPKYAVLVGDASADPRDYQGLGSTDYVPTQIVATQKLRTASDSWLADFDGDGVENIALGRLPVRTAEEAALVVGKIASRGTPSGSWAQSALMVSDAVNGYDFPAATANLLPLVPQAISTRTVGFGDTATPKDAFTTAFNQGHLLVNYFGHGGTETLGSNVFTSADAASLTNGSQLPVTMLIACYTGYFHRPGANRSVAEALLLAPNGGSVAVWAASTLTMATPEVALNQEVVRQLFGTTAPAIGDAMKAAKLAVTDRDVRVSYILFGDPSLKLR